MLNQSARLLISTLDNYLKDASQGDCSRFWQDAFYEELNGAGPLLTQEQRDIYAARMREILAQVPQCSNEMQCRQELQRRGCELLYYYPDAPFCTVIELLRCGEDDYKVCAELGEGADRNAIFRHFNQWVGKQKEISTALQKAIHTLYAAL